MCWNGASLRRAVEPPVVCVGIPDIGLQNGVHIKEPYAALRSRIFHLNNITRIQDAAHPSHSPVPHLADSLAVRKPPRSLEMFMARLS